MSVPRIRIAVIAGCIAVGSLAVAGCGGGSSTSTTGASGASGTSGAAGSEPVSAADFAASVCPAVAGLQATVAKVEQTSKQAVVGEQDPAALKNQLITSFSNFADSTQQFATTVKAAGTPDIPNGEQIKSDLDAYLDQLTALFQRVEKSARALPTSSSQAFVSAAKSFDANLRQASAQLQQSAPDLGSSPELNQAAEQTPSCQPLLQGG